MINEFQRRMPEVVITA